MIEFAIHEWSRTTALDRMAHRCSLTPGPILAPAPTTTLGPRTAVGSTSAVYCQLDLEVRVPSSLQGQQERFRHKPICSLRGRKEEASE
jgi:hypothetical protein